MLDTVTLASLVAAGKPTDGTDAKFYYNSELGFKVVTNFSHTGEGSVVTSTSIIEWNKYGDLIKNDLHSVDANVDPKVASDIHVIGDFTYSSSKKPDPKPVGDDAVETQAIKHGVEALMNQEKLTAQVTLLEEMGGISGIPDVETAILNGDEYYSLADSMYGKNYELITKKDSKNLYASFSNVFEHASFSYVDENHAKDMMKHKYFDNGLFESVNYLAECQSFEKFADFVILKMASGDFTPVTKSDYKVEIEKKVLDSSDRYALVTIIMNDDWVSKQTMQGMQLTHLEIGCSFTYNDNFLVSYVNTEIMSISAGGQEMSVKEDALCTFDNKVDETLKNEVLTELSKKEIPDIISNHGAPMTFKVDGYNIYTQSINDYKDNTTGAFIINGVVNDPQSKLNKVLAPLGSTVTIKYYFNGKEVPNYSNIVLSSYENVFNIVVNASDESKCAVAYAYRKVTHLSHGTTSDEVYNVVVVDKTNSYTIQTSFGGVDYSDKYGTIDFVLSEPKYDISNLSSIIFLCVKDIPYVPRPFEEESFTLDSITNYQEIKDKEISEGYTVGEHLDEFLNSTLYFADGEQCALNLANGDSYYGTYSEQGIGYTAYFYGPSSFPCSFTFDSATDTINLEYEINLMDFTTVTAHLVYALD